jgi:hypothetical protein
MANKATNANASIRKLAVVGIAALTLIALAPGAHAEAKGKDRPIKGSCDVVITPETDPGVFPVIMAFDMACHLSHLGVTTASTEESIVTPAGPPVGTVVPITQSLTLTVYTAANGDQLFSTYTGTGTNDFASGAATFEGTETYLGGTGRFVGATGQAHIVGTASVFTNRGFFTTSGNISY